MQEGSIILLWELPEWNASLTTLYCGIQSMELLMHTGMHLTTLSCVQTMVSCLMRKKFVFAEPVVEFAGFEVHPEGFRLSQCIILSIVKLPFAPQHYRYPFMVWPGEPGSVRLRPG